GALLASQRMRRIVTLAVPYGPAFFRALRENYAQQKRSWYMLFFQHALAEEVLPRDGYAMIEHLYRDWSPGWEAPRDMLDSVKEPFARPGTLQAALAYYRHTIRPPFDDPAQFDGMLQAMGVPLQVPALYLHGADDGCIGADLAQGVEPYFARGVHVEVVPGSGHFLHQERPEIVNRAILDFLQG